ncbi:MAG: CPBP family intramembrane metalloprotease, partial [Chloroflexi bacterium]
MRKELGAALLAAPVVWASIGFLWPETLHAGMMLENARRFLLLAGLYPVAEEVVFRGVIQGWMLDRSWGSRRLGLVSRANFSTSLLFAVLHLPAHPPLMAMLT